MSKPEQEQVERLRAKVGAIAVLAIDLERELEALAAALEDRDEKPRPAAFGS